MRLMSFPADVISYCSAEGDIRPLRVRSLNCSYEKICGNICEIIKTKESGHYGAEKKSFLCRICTEQQTRVLELQYAYRTHNWSIILMVKNMQ